MSTGNSEHITHSGAGDAAAYELKLKCLAVLTDCDVEYINSSIDFWMSDRAGDCASHLDNLGITVEQILKCSANIILGVDHVLDKVIRNTEK